MSRPASDLALLGNPHLAALATRAAPAWLWSGDGRRIVWANPAGAAIFGGDTPGSLSARDVSQERTGLQIARLANALPQGAPPRLERLRGFAPGVERLLTCACSRIAINNESYILVAATEPAGPNLPLAERARRLFADCDETIAVFSRDGTLLHASAAAQSLLKGAKSLEALGAGAAVAIVMRDSRAETDLADRRVTIERIGTDANAILVAQFAAAPPSEIDISPIAHAMVQAGAPQAATGADAKDRADDAEDTVRRYPLRFVWQIDPQGLFSINTGEFSILIGTTIASALGRPWSEIAATFNLDPTGEIARALASRDTWSGITVAWPVEGSDRRIEVQLSGLPIFERDRTFKGYRGFGVCRDLARLAELSALRRAAAEGLPQPKVTMPRDNVVPFRNNLAAADQRPPALSPVEHDAFRELARRLTERLHDHDARGDKDDAASAEKTPAAEKPAEEKTAAESPAAAPGVSPADGSPQVPAIAAQNAPILDHLPAGIVVYCNDKLLYANRAFLAVAGYDTLAAFADAGGLDSLLIGDGGAGEDESSPVIITTASGGERTALAQQFMIPWEGAPARALMMSVAAPTRGESSSSVPAALGKDRELSALLDIAADGVFVLDREGNILTANPGAATLFGYEADMLTGHNLRDLFGPESQRLARECLDGVARKTEAAPEGREIAGRMRQGGLIPLFVTIGRISETEDKFGVVIRDITRWKRTEEELTEAKRRAEKASSAKSEFLAKISHEIRTPLNAIIGFSEVMMEERFGPVGNDRYRDYLKDIHASGGHLISLLNDLLDLSKIEAGKIELNFAGLDLNDVTQQCVTLMQPQANRERIIIRTSLPPGIPPVVADARSVRQIVLNLLSNSIKFTRAGGQVIVSTAITDHGDVALRVRDTGIGMSETDIETALEPFRQLATSVRPGTVGSGLGLPLTKALAEANRAHFKIKSAVDDGTLVEITFPRARAAAE